MNVRSRLAMTLSANSCVICCNKRQRVIALSVVIFFVIILGKYASVSMIVCENVSQGALPPEDKSNCVEVHERRTVGKLELKHKLQRPLCDNILNNLTLGHWVESISLNIEKERRKLDTLLEDFRVLHEGFTKLPYREDKKCGLKQLVTSPACSMVKVDASAWCDPYSSTPCCSNKHQGVCVAEKECHSQDSINLAQYMHAELARWQPIDKRCRFVEYNQATACSLLHQKKVRKITFIGNSLMRNMYSVFLQMLTDNYHNGSVVSCMPQSMRDKCIGPWQNMDKYCLGIALAPSSEGLPGPGICGGHLKDLVINLKMFYVASFGKELKEYVESELDNKNSFLLVGIGIHDQYKGDLIINEYLSPAVQALSGHEWPKLIWVHTVKTGLFKPPQFTSLHGTDEDIEVYIAALNKFCHSHNIATMDLSHLTTGVWSVEGTHFGTAVNRMKLQFFLNYLSLM